MHLSRRRTGDMPRLSRMAIGIITCSFLFSVIAHIFGSASRPALTGTCNALFSDEV